MGYKRMNGKGRFRASHSFIKYLTIGMIIFTIALLFYGQRAYRQKISRRVGHISGQAIHFIANDYNSGIEDTVC